MNIEKRNIGTCIVLSIVTCGIYAIIWAIKMLKEAVQVKDQNDDGTVEIILGILLCPVGFFMAEKKFAEGCAAKGIAHEDRSILYLILGFVGLGIVDFAMMQSDLNKIADLCAGAPAPDVRYQAPQAPQYQAPQYQAPQAPQYQAPQYQAPQAPQYQAPQYQAPQAPQYEAPAAPQYEAPVDTPPTDPTL